LEADAHERLRAGLEDALDRVIQGLEMVTAVFGQELKILLNEQPDQPRAKRSDLADPAVPHRFVRQTALSESHAVDLQWPKPFAKGGSHRDLTGLGDRSRESRQRENRDPVCIPHASPSIG